MNRNGSACSSRDSETMVVTTANCIACVLKIMLLDVAEWLLVLEEEHNFFFCFYLYSKINANYPSHSKIKG